MLLKLQTAPALEQGVDKDYPPGDKTMARKGWPEETMLAVSGRLRIARLTTGLSQVKLSQELEVNQKTYGTWENGQYMPDPVALGVLAEVYGIPLDYIFLGVTSGMNATTLEKIQIASSKNR